MSNFSHITPDMAKAISEEVDKLLESGSNLSKITSADGKCYQLVTEEIGSRIVEHYELVTD